MLMLPRVGCPLNWGGLKLTLMVPVLMEAEILQLVECFEIDWVSGFRSLLLFWVLMVSFLPSFEEPLMVCNWHGIVVLGKFGWRLTLCRLLL